MQELLITSYIDRQYYILSKNFANFLLLSPIITNSIGNKNNEEEKYPELDSYNRILLDKSIDPPVNLFVYKESELGQQLTSLIKQKRILDARYVATKDILINALLSTLLKGENIFLLKDERDIRDLINLGLQGSIYESKFSRYETSNLSSYIRRGREYSVSKKLVPELTGFEEEGLIYQEGELYYFNIRSKEKNPLKKNPPYKKTKIFPC